MKILCVFGKHQYGDASRGMGIEYTVFIPALTRLGHEVVHFDSWERNRYPSYAELNQALLETIDRERPDVMLTVQMHYELWLETLELIKARGNVATISWTTDDSWKYRETSRFIGSAYHAMTTTYVDYLLQYHRDGIDNVLLTQWAVSADALQEPLPTDSCRYQVSFVGAAHAYRQQKVAELAAQGVEVTCFGYGWQNGSVAADEIPKIIRASVISLNFANALKGANQIKARTFEVPGAGGFLLTENADELSRSYILDREIVVFDSTAELATKIKYFLANPVEREQIAQAGFLRTKQEHTYDLRMQEAINFAIASRDRWLHQSQQPSNNNNNKLFEDAVRKHRLTPILKSLRAILILICTVLFGKEKSIKAARRISFEISWRVCGRKTYLADGWVSRMFPYN
jgi:spore maturation protein CgeB